MDPLRVKELAESMRVSRRFVYQMRACGFPMRGDDHSQTATVQEAQDWIKTKRFRLVKGIGVVGSGLENGQTVKRYNQR